MQSVKKRESRIESIKDAFIIKIGASLYNKNILLVDDVITTGATVTERTKILLQAGAKNVYCISFTKSLGDEIFDRT